jgi:hypothetical protein
LARIPDPKANPANPLCIVCQGRDPACWCCVQRLTGPPKAAPVAASGGYPDLQEWVSHYGGYNKIPWAEWDVAVAAAQARPAPLPGPPRCVHCGGEHDEPDNLLIKVICVGFHKYGFVHARCWEARRAEEASWPFVDAWGVPEEPSMKPKENDNVPDED